METLTSVVTFVPNTVFWALGYQEQELVLHYWGVKNRAYATLVIAKAGGLPLSQNTNPDIAAMKPDLPFGQLPYLVHGDVKVAQSNAILRYVAKLAGLQGDTAADYALSEMLIEEAHDIHDLVNKAQYAPDKVKAYKELFAPDSSLRKQLEYLEKLHPGDGPFFKAGPKRIAGGYAIACTLDILVHLEPTILEGYPKLAEFLKAMLALPEFEGAKDQPMYFTR